MRDIEGLMVWQAHAAIREDPKFEKKERKNPGEKRSWKAQKLSYDERKANLKVSNISPSCDTWATALKTMMVCH